jgi:hypothetical protein
MSTFQGLVAILIDLEMLGLPFASESREQIAGRGRHGQPCGGS